MSTLSNHIRQHIVANGPITIAKYMEEALSHPRLGYYMSEDPLGRRGDFITAPEISQMFGELIGLWCGIQWRTLGEKSPFNLIELGPGHGTLMADILRAGQGVEGFLESLVLSLVEISPVLKGIQEETLLSSVGGEVRRTRALSWISQLSEVPDGPFAAVANEFIDVLGIRQFQKTVKGWRERLVDVSESEPDKFQYVLSQALPDKGIVPSDLKNTSIGDILEVRPAASVLINEFCSRLKYSPGCVLLIDYGHNITACGDTLQAIKDHAYYDPMDSPGTADLTAHVDFGELYKIAIDNGVAVFGPVTQSAFLSSLGIHTRAKALAKASPKNANEIFEALARLTSDDSMGALFKVLVLTSPGMIPPPGFE
jgi:NADH dehydrogenase [ubiquinone] 1 alpha subcomplex assembly factor 7